MINNVKTLSISRHVGYKYRAVFFWAMVLTSLLSLFVYIYAINTTARNIALRQGLEREISAASTNLDALEFTYIQLKNNVTIELAYNQGFKEERNPLYISRAPSASLSFNTIDR